MKTFTNSKEKSFLSEIQNILQINDTISIIANSFSFYLLKKLSSFNKNIRFQIIISDTAFKDFFDEAFDYEPKDKLYFLEFIKDLIKMINDHVLIIKKEQGISYSALITDSYSFAPLKPKLDAKNLGFSLSTNDTTSPIMQFENKENDFFKKEFEQKWKNTTDISSDIKEYLQDLLNITPNEMYYFILHNILHNDSFISDEKTVQTNSSKLESTKIWELMYKFQKDAVKEIQKRLDKLGICILADSVGLGKTFTALGIIKDYQMQGKRVLVLCPKKLENNWNQYLSYTNKKTNILDEDNFNYTVLFHTDLLRTNGKHGNIDFNDFNWGAFGLVVIDESHNLRTGFSDRKDANGNPVENRYSFFINKIMNGESKPKLLLLSATPVNNKFKDLENQLRLAYDGEERAFNRNFPEIQNVQTLFRNADATFTRWMKRGTEITTASLVAELDSDFIKLIETVSIARSRNHIRKFYNSQDIQSFPIREKPITIDDYGENSETDYDTIAYELTNLRLTVYTPYIYIQPEKQKKYPDIFTETRMKNLTAAGRSAGMIALMRSNLLKRLESSSNSFKTTLDSILEKINSFIQIIDEYEKKSDKLQSNENITFFYDDTQNALQEDIDNYSEEESSIIPIIQNTNRYQIKLCDMNYKNWKTDLKSDKQKLEELKEKVERSAEDDKKLKKLKQIIKGKINNPLNNKNKKIIIFTAFADTAKYLYDNLYEWAENEFNIKTALVTGTKCETNISGIGNDFDKTLTFFSPRSKFKDKIYADETGEIDLLIATDCISEGQNLQDCDYLINYDIHWNPVRIIQRFGRIDRIGSVNQKIQLVNFWPSKNLDSYIKLKTRVEAKMAATVLSGTGDENVLTDEQKKELDFRAEQIAKEFSQINDGNMELQNSFTITDYSLYGFKADYNDFKNKQGLDLLPNAISIELQADNNKGLTPGAIFLFLEDEKNDKQAAQKKKHNPIYPYKLIYSKKDGTTEENVNELLSKLRIVCKENSTVLSEVNESDIMTLLKTALYPKDSTSQVKSLFTLDKITETRTSATKKDIVCCIIIK